jgi:type 1 glutamine amidotransferase
MEAIDSVAKRRNEAVAKLHALLLVGGPAYHNQPFQYAELTGILAGEGQADLCITDDLETLNPAELARYEVVVNWSTFVQPTEAQVEALLHAIDRGAGFLGLHGASATFWNSARYLRMLGSRFNRHDPYKTFTVRIDDHTHPITAGVADFEVDDELYELNGGTQEFEALAAAINQGKSIREARDAANEAGEGALGPGIHVLASAEGHPLLYVKDFGRGRVHYNALGHDLKALTNPNVRRLILQGFAWVAQRP